MNARDAIGKSIPRKDRLSFDSIQEALGENAPDLLEILESARIQGYFKMRSKASAAANNAQSMFRKVSLISILGVAIATLASGLLLYGAGASGGVGTAATETAAAVGTDDVPASQTLAEFLDRNRIYFVVLQVAGAFLTAVTTTILSSQDYVGRWSDNRRRAEDLRRQIFTEIFNQAATRKDATTLGADNLLSFDQGCRFVVTLTVAVRAPYTLAVGGDSGADTKPWRRETLQHRLNLCRIRHLQNPVQNRFRRRLESPSLFIAPRTECLQFRLVQGAGVLRRANAACDASKPRGDEDSKHRCNGVLAALSAAEVRNPQQFVIERA